MYNIKSKQESKQKKKNPASKVQTLTLVGRLIEPKCT